MHYMYGVGLVGVDTKPRSTLDSRSSRSLTVPFAVTFVSMPYHFESGVPRKGEFECGPTVFAGDGHVAFVEVHH